MPPTVGQSLLARLPADRLRRAIRTRPGSGRAGGHPRMANVSGVPALGIDPEGVLGRCKLCRVEMTIANLTALFPRDLKVVCQRHDCIAGVQEPKRGASTA